MLYGVCVCIECLANDSHRKNRNQLDKFDYFYGLIFVAHTFFNPASVVMRSVVVQHISNSMNFGNLYRFAMRSVSFDRSCDVIFDVVTSK